MLLIKNKKCISLFSSTDAEQLYFRGANTPTTYKTYLHTVEYSNNQWKFGVVEVVDTNGTSFSLDTCPEQPVVYEITGYELNYSELETGRIDLLQKHNVNGKTRYKVHPRRHTTLYGRL